MPPGFPSYKLVDGKKVMAKYECMGCKKMFEAGELIDFQEDEEDTIYMFCNSCYEKL